MGWERRGAVNVWVEMRLWGKGRVSELALWNRILDMVGVLF